MKPTKLSPTQEKLKKHLKPIVEGILNENEIDVEDITNEIGFIREQLADLDNVLEEPLPARQLTALFKALEKINDILYKITDKIGN